jgi:transcriptional regulator with XRE-family HTH domain
LAIKSRRYAASRRFFSRQDNVVHTIKRLGQNICKLRVNARRTQFQLSEEAQIDRSFLQRIEAGKSSPTAITLIRIKKGLNCSWGDIFFGVNDTIDAMAPEPRPVSTRQLRPPGRIDRSFLQKIVEDLDSLIRESANADQFELQELREALVILKKLVARPPAP